MNNFLKLLLLLCITPFCTISAQLPPIFETDKYQNVQISQLTTAYLSPTRIIWKSGNIQNEDILLLKGKGQADLTNSRICTMNSKSNNQPSVILDYGKELHGGIQIITGNTTGDKPVKIRLRFGESVSEAMSDIGEKGATNDHAIRDAIIEIPRLGNIEFGNTGFRFVRIDMIEPNTELQIKEVRAKLIYQDIPYLGSFHSSDTLLNKIWMTGAYTVHLNLQDYLWDGIKRDRLVWIGDIHPEVSTVNAVFGYNASVNRSLDLSRDITPLPNWMTGISSYSMWWIITHRDWYMNNGDFKYLKEQKEYLIPLLQQLVSMIDENGSEKLNGWRFLDWPSSNNDNAIHAGLQAMMVLSLSAGKDLCLILDEKNMARECKNAIAKLLKYQPSPADSKQAAALLSLSELIDSEQATDIIINDGVRNFSTFYGYYMLQALAKSGNYETALESIRKYWGGMLSVGATTFWEDFNIDWLDNTSRIDELPQPGKKDIHADYGDYCYKGLRHSLCHGWASGPTAWLSEHVLGIKAIEPGCRKIKIEPHLGDLDFVEGTYPTPLGVVKVKHTKMANGKIKSEIKAPKGIEITR